LKKVKDLPKSCTDYIVLHDTCKADIEKHCTGKEYSGDLLVCLTEWTKPDALSPECVAKFPKKETTERKKSAAEQMKADRRRRARKEAAKRLQKDL
jgi:Cysteine rich repeat